MLSIKRAEANLEDAASLEDVDFYRSRFDNDSSRLFSTDEVNVNILWRSPQNTTGFPLHESVPNIHMFPAFKFCWNWS